LLCNRSWEQRYGVDILVQAFAAAGRRSPGLRLILLGSGSQAQILRQILIDGGVIDRVEFGGRVSQADLPRWYRKSDVFVSSSHVDGSSVSLMEALACGVPALVSDIPANKEWVQEGVNGWLFQDGNSDALAEKILWIAARSRQLGAIGQRARQVAERRADWTENFPVLLKSYEEAVRLNSSGPE
jgi:glycosyltransferase involved in cell wall biosynthesis